MFVFAHSSCDKILIEVSQYFIQACVTVFSEILNPSTENWIEHLGYIFQAQLSSSSYSASANSITHRFLCRFTYFWRKTCKKSFLTLYKLFARSFSRSAMYCWSIPADPAFSLTSLNACTTSCLGGFVVFKISSSCELHFVHNCLTQPLRSMAMTTTSSLLRVVPPQ